MGKFLLCFGAWLLGGLAATWVTVQSNSLVGIVVLAVFVLTTAAWLVRGGSDDRNPFPRYPSR